MQGLPIPPSSTPRRVLLPFEDRPALSFATNDYLGLARDPRVIAAAQDATAKLGWGSTGSRLLSGDRQVFHDLEGALAQWKYKDMALLFGSGYALNLGVLSTFWGQGDVIFADRLCHASMVDGIRLSGAKLIRFAHQDLGHLRGLLAKHRKGYRKAVIVTESVFSMDGDCTDVGGLVALKQEFETDLMVDEAHALGVFGPHGEGLIGADLAPKVDYIVGTLGKALGGMGGFVACSAEARETLIQGARSLIYSTALPPAIAAAGLAALAIVKTEQRGATVLAKAQYLRDRLTVGCPGAVLGESHIIPVVLGAQVGEVSARLREAGIDCPAIRHPTVPKGQERLRLSVTWYHSQADLDRLALEIHTDFELH